MIPNDVPKPYGYRALVKMKLIEQKTKGGIIITETNREREQLAQVKGQLVASGELAFHEIPDKPKLGEQVFVRKYCGTHIESADGFAYRLCDDADLMGVFPDDSHLPAEKVI